MGTFTSRCMEYGAECGVEPKAWRLPLKRDRVIVALLDLTREGAVLTRRGPS
jgi:hypothetical protein